ncbi:uncharacterized protein LOC119261806 [Pygocentrus nattereri]|uniref:uncharacterized protein LOC119261806 n=1 Tax=Pygocentrus nattereri TaxID=42514 RepID=UPI0018911F7C|nr:uncharacterized protein LOC119261806 [Pygocentrus nattereri]
MQSCSSAHCVLILLIFTFTAVYVSAVPPVKVKLNETATLPCYESCAGVVRWTVSHKPRDVLAECDQTSCRSVKEGYQMIHDQYLKGNLSLIITNADLSKSSTYTCECGKSEICDVYLQVEEKGTENSRNSEGMSHVKVKLHDSATLRCSERCSGLARWTVFHKPRDALAECDQTSCRSVKEGYQMIHDQYLKGDLSLTITDTDFSKRTSYTCDCDGKDLCDVALKIETVNTLVQIKAGESLVLNLDILDPLEVIYDCRGASGTFSGQICTVDGQSLECKPEYKHRMSKLTSDLELREMKPSDSGVYTIRDIKTKEDIHVYSVIVQDKPQPPWWSIVLITAFVILVLVALSLYLMKYSQTCRRRIQRFYRFLFLLFIEMYDIKLYSLNLNGARDARKRAVLYEMLKVKQVDGLPGFRKQTVTA